MGALSVPPLERYPLGTVRPIRVTAEQHKKKSSKAPADCPQLTALSGTTPSGCTQRAPTGTVSTRNGPPDPSDSQPQKKHPMGVPDIFRLKFLLKKNDLEINLQGHLLERSPGERHWRRTPASQLRTPP